MIEYEKPKSRKNKACLQLKTGSCGGCNVLDMIANRARWKRMSLRQASKEVNLCCVSPQLDLIPNDQASFAMGQRRKENLDFSGTDIDTNGEKLHRRY